MLTGSVFAALHCLPTMRAPALHRHIALAVATCVLLAFAPALYAESISGVRVQDEVWEVNVRPVACSTSENVIAERLEVRQYVVDESGNCRRWVNTDLAQLSAAAGDGMVTVFYVHGNKVDPSMARDRSLRVYRTLTAHATDDRPVRYVIFSWPASEVNGLLRDFRVKAVRTRPVGWELAWVLNQMPVDAKISLIGYSYGARIIGGAMHALAGGDLSGASLPSTGQHAPMRVAFIAAATHSNWFGPNGYHDLAMHQIDRLMMLNNQLDPAMRHYDLVETNCSPQAMGLCGPTSLIPGAREQIQCFDCTNCVGKSHDLFDYMSTGSTIATMWQHVMFMN